MRRYGLNGTPAQDHGEIAGWLGVGTDRSRQLEREALHRLREAGRRPRARCARGLSFRAVRTDARARGAAGCCEGRGCA